MKRFPRLFPLLLVLLLSLLTIVLDRVTREKSSAFEVDASQPEYTVENFTATRFNEAGLLQDRLTAKKMWQYPKSKEIDFDAPRLTSYKNGQVNYTVDGEVGRYNSASRKVWFDRRVEMNDPGRAGAQPVRLETRAMTVDLATSVARGPAPVTVWQGDSVLRATGFVYEQPKGVVSLLSNVRIHYVQP
ncbi:LPS export ABC transporter periplasmic protein LptC [Crenobacter intestini]|uniref:LPS export ABC transporter periplasmic protein LptC n=1 Tax=Crenobacter intestini TaxID=2563443 RepID=A0A4T0UZF1_9NEIS|nr:LPS export ABC transporter periplasmic protein LptC [Crenobacter intestini]TIC84592.1 LPS export ABC transporter periplasmic protein LptC [Crenobacter intestini]